MKVSLNPYALAVAVLACVSCSRVTVLHPPDVPELARAGLVEALDLMERKPLIPGLVEGREVEGVVRGYSRWRGTVTMTGDVLVPAGAVLVIDPGTVVRVAEASSSRTEPEFVGNETELLIEGRLEARGKGEGITFEAEGKGETWYGIVFRGAGASAGTLEGTTVRDAEQGITLLDASPTLRDILIERGTYGLLTLGASRPVISGVRLADLDYGSVGPIPEGAHLGIRERLAVTPPSGVVPTPPPPTGVARAGGPAVLYEGKERTHFIVEDTRWEGRIVIDGTVQVLAGAVLTILPGTRVEFTPFDFEGDGIGDSQIIVSGGLRVLGEPGAEVLFTSAGIGRPGSWGMVSLLASDREDNLIRHARFENAYRGFHNHFSSMVAESSVFTGNLRGLQFQEADVTLRDCWIGLNRSGIRCRDSRITLEGTVIGGNQAAASILRSTGLITGCRISANPLEGLWIRESDGLSVLKTEIRGNRRGIRARDSVLELSGCAVSGNAENGISLQGGAATVVGSRVTDNGLDGISVENTAATLRGNDIAGNGEFAIDNQGTRDLVAEGTWWGGGEPAIRDRSVDPTRGSVTRTGDATGPNTTAGAAPSDR